MKQSANNPVTNTLPKSTTEQAIIDAIKKSGYPVQGIIAQTLSKEFNVTEEPGYIDQDSGEHRSLDLLAYRPFSGDPHSNTRPSAALLIECKRSIHPYVFFRRVSGPPIREIPKIASIPKQRPELGDGRYSRAFPPAAVLGLHQHKFVTPGPPVSAAFSRARLDNKKVRLSGDDPYFRIILPLVKAVEFRLNLHSINDKEPQVFLPMLLHGVAVLDAPMILVDSPDRVEEPILSPWIRMVRQLASREGRQKPPNEHIIDLVHLDYFDTFIQEHFLPFVTDFTKHAIQRRQLLIHGGNINDVPELAGEEFKLH